MTKYSSIYIRDIFILFSTYPKFKLIGVTVMVPIMTLDKGWTNAYGGNMSQRAS